MKLSDWQALDARIGRKVMGWVPGRTRNGAYKIWQTPNYDRTKYLVDRDWAATGGGLEFWQPHKNVGQAMLVKECIVKERWPGCRFSMDSIQHLHCRVSFERSGQVYRGSHMVDAKAICLAIEKWLDAQKEE